MCIFFCTRGVDLLANTACSQLIAKVHCDDSATVVALEESVHTRREFLKRSTALVGAMACSGGKDTSGPSISERSPEPSPWVPEGETDWSAFPFGVLVGDVGPHSAVVQVHSELDSSVLQWVLVVGQSGEWVEAQRGECSTGDIHPNTTRIELEGLDSDHVYSIVFTSADQPLLRPSDRFRTALTEADWRIVKFAVTSCFAAIVPFHLLPCGRREGGLVCYLGIWLMPMALKRR